MTPENFKMLLEDLERRVAWLETNTDGSQVVGPVGVVGPLADEPQDFDALCLLDWTYVPGALPGMSARSALLYIMDIHNRREHMGDIIPGQRITLDGSFSAVELESIAFLAREAEAKSGVFPNDKA